MLYPTHYSGAMRMLEQPVLQAQSICLRPFSDKDVLAVQQASLDEYISQITTLPYEATSHEALSFIQRQRQRVLDATGYSFAIVDEQSDLTLGQIGLWLRNAQRGRASIGYWVVPEHRGRRVVTTALETITAWGLEHPGIHRLELYVEPWNVASWTAAENCGFEREGLLRGWEIINGQPKDLYMYSRLRPDL